MHLLPSKRDRASANRISHIISLCRCRGARCFDKHSQTDAHMAVDQSSRSSLVLCAIFSMSCFPHSPRTCSGASMRRCGLGERFDKSALTKDFSKRRIFASCQLSAMTLAHRWALWATRPILDRQSAIAAMRDPPEMDHTRECDGVKLPPWPNSRNRISLDFFSLVFIPLLVVKLIFA